MRQHSHSWSEWPTPMPSASEQKGRTPEEKARSEKILEANRAAEAELRTVVQRLMSATRRYEARERG